MADRDISLRLAVVDAAASIRRLREFGAQGESALRKLETSGKPATAALTALNTASLGAQRSFGLALPAITGFAAGMLGAVAAPLSLAAAIRSGIEASEDAERSYLRLEGVLKATGGAAGISARDISTFAEELERSTLNSSEAVKDAAAALATFRSISGDAFTRTISLATDMAAVFGTNLVSATTQLGKALEDPIRGLSSLREVGVTFSQEQRDVITALVETGDAAAAQAEILGVLEQQLGGAAAAEAGGLTGAFHRAGAALGDLLQTMTEVSGVSQGLTGYLDQLGRDADRLSARIAGPQTALQTLAEATVELERAQRAVTALEGRQGAQGRLEEERANVARLTEEIEGLREAYVDEVRARGDVRRAAEAQAEAAQAEAQAAREREDAEKAAEQAAKARERAQAAAATAAARLAERQREAVANAEAQADQQQRLRIALEESVDAYDDVAAAIEIENALRAVNLDLTSAEGQALALAISQRQAEAEAIDEVRAARARLAALEDQRLRRIEDRGFDPAASAADYNRGRASGAPDPREAERLAQIYTDVFARAVDRIGETFSDTLAAYRNDELDNFEDFAASLGDIMAAPFEQLSGAVFSSLFEGIVGDLSTQIKAAATSGQFDVAGLVGAFNNPLGAAALGASIGGIGAQALGVGNQYTSLGGGIGSGLGFAAGSAYGGPAGGAIGGLLGGLLGTGIAAAFGGGGGERDNVGTAVRLDDLSVNAGGTPNQNTQRAQQLGAQVAGVIQGLRSQGIEFDEGGRIKFNVNNGRSDQDILQGATRQVRELAVTDDPLIRQVLEASTARTPTALLGDIEFARFFEQLTGAAGPAEEALRALNAQFDEAGRRARQLGLDEAALADAREQATRDLLRGAEDAVLAQADGIRAIFDARTGPLQAAIDAITIGPGSALSTQEQLAQVRGEFDALAARADAGELVDFNRLAGLGQQVVGLSREFDASGALFQAAFRDVNLTLQRVIEEQTGRQDDLLSALPDALRDAQRDQTAALGERLDKMVAELERLTRTVEQQARVA